MPSNHLIICRPSLLLPPIPPSIRIFSSESALCLRWPKCWSFSFNISLSNEHPGLISFMMDWLDLLAVQGTLKCLPQHHSSKTSILWCSAFFIVQLSLPYMTTRKTIALTRRTFIGKVMSLLFNMLSRLVTEKAMAPHSRTLAWKIPWMEETGRLQSMVSLRVGHDWATSLSLFIFMHWRTKWQPTPVFLPGASQGLGGPGGLPSMGSHKVRHDWSDLAAARLLITFLPRSKRLLISWLQSPSAVILEPPKIKSDTVYTVSPSICHEVMGPDAMILVFWELWCPMMKRTSFFGIGSRRS